MPSPEPSATTSVKRVNRSTIAGLAHPPSAAAQRGVVKWWNVTTGSRSRSWHAVEDAARSGRGSRWRTRPPRARCATTRARSGTRRTRGRAGCRGPRGSARGGRTRRPTAPRTGCRARAPTPTSRCSSCRPRPGARRSRCPRGNRREGRRHAGDRTGVRVQHENPEARRDRVLPHFDTMTVLDEILARRSATR